MEYICKKIDEKMAHLKHDSISLSLFLEEIETYNPIIIGGFIRNVINNEQIRDIDIILLCDSDIIENIIKKCNLNYSKNRFNGYKVLADNIVLDIWSIDNHNLFEKGLYEKKFENIKETTFINYDSLVYDLINRKLDIKYYQDFLNSNIIDFVGNNEAISNNNQIYFSIVKILNICYNKNTNISLEIQKYILSHYDEEKNTFVLKLKSEYLKHYNHEMEYELENYIINFLTRDKEKSLIKKYNYKRS